MNMKVLWCVGDSTKWRAFERWKLRDPIKRKSQGYLNDETFVLIESLWKLPEIPSRSKVIVRAKK